MGELVFFSLCYLHTAGRLTLTVIKRENLKAVDIAGSSDLYVMLCDGRSLKNKKTTMKNTPSPGYNEASIIFDIPLENMHQVSLLFLVVDYDPGDHSEITGVCHVGINACETTGTGCLHTCGSTSHTGIPW